MSERHHESGFTLVEVLVTVLILGLLAAVVFPVVVPQVDKADPTVASNDLANIRTGIEMFQLDVRPTEPGDIEDLANDITTADADVTGTTFNSGQVDRWEGPYVDLTASEIDIASSSSDPVVLSTGFEASMLNDLYRFDSNSTVEDNSPEPTASSADFVAIRIINLTADEFADLDDQIDDGDGASSGRLRRDDSPDNDLDGDATTGDGSGLDTVTYYLAIPFTN